MPEGERTPPENLRREIPFDLAQGRLSPRWRNRGTSG